MLLQQGIHSMCRKQYACMFQYRKRYVLLQLSILSVNPAYIVTFQYRKRYVLLQLNNGENSFVGGDKFQYRKR